MRAAKHHVRFTPESGHVPCSTRFPLWANRGRWMGCAGHWRIRKLKPKVVKLLGLRYHYFDKTASEIMRYLGLIVLVSIFGVGLNTAAFAVCCPAGSVENGYGGCW